MAKLTTAFLRDRLRRLENGGRFGLSPDRFAEIFPPGHQDSDASEDARRLAAGCRCIMDYWRATNEVFFSKPPRADAAPEDLAQ